MLLKLIQEQGINLQNNRFMRCYEIDSNNYLTMVKVSLTKMQIISHKSIIGFNPQNVERYKSFYGNRTIT